ncbi:hypothetical protein PGT21_021059 [Puccinia graminis f. sp. tritici]|uniref:Uncharacterized protein n=1 Tax=Puccinia graminis f. sp. tritici TaxID=56615 RepID=A0A5B0R1T0_PUCGR|nr:hypothetical protein PGT21_021011 [Puccinia graminis f. sp. tritici]KAA1119293.1 hypothetical protein PGT21_021059 [Puccinia graminis f. sp. tritici]
MMKTIELTDPFLSFLSESWSDHNPPLISYSLRCSGPKSIIEDLPQGWDDQRWNKPNENLIHIICQGKCFFNNQKGFNP